MASNTDPIVRFDVSRADIRLINAIVDRAFRSGSPLKERKGDDRTDLSMDITACHRNGCRLDLVKLLGFDEFNFWHDIGGIRNCINRRTGKLENHFLPRCSLPKKNLKGRTSRADAAYLRGVRS